MRLSVRFTNIKMITIEKGFCKNAWTSDINSSASKTCFVTAMLAHMLMLIIQNRFHLLLKYFSIRNSLIDVPSAPLFVDAVSIFVAYAVEFQVGVLGPEDFSVSNLPLRGLTIRRSCVCCSVCMRNA